MDSSSLQTSSTVLRAILYLFNLIQAERFKLAAFVRVEEHNFRDPTSSIAQGRNVPSGKAFKMNRASMRLHGAVWPTRVS